ncbi:DUF4159 domain-containing protein [Neptunicoccus sediminis]|uniref:DUF4159 domain-containing protein n=1 Tax=Neptunicoccus sediminis TaxID=1892596 RepID=UPI0008461F24|nr:DUF4159 domain-containing protein [Neptunicoccus sediminis]
MIGLGSLGFLAPWLLLGLLALPVLWWLLRAVPPAPLRRRFPAVTLLLGLEDRETTPDRTPWWLLLLRMAAVAAAILAFAQPVLNPSDRIAGRAPLLIALDGSWASAQSWTERQDKLDEILQFATQDGRSVAVINLSERPRGENPLSFDSADSWRGRIKGEQPRAWEPDYAVWQDVIAAADPFETLWLSDGLAREGRAELFAVLSEKGAVSVAQSERDVLALRGIEIEGGALSTTALRLGAGSAPARAVKVVAEGPDPAGITRSLAQGEAAFDAGGMETVASVTLPSELRNRVRRVSLEGVRSAGAVVLTDDSLQRRKVALIGGGSEQEGAVLVSPLHFLRKALVPTAEVIEAGLADSLQATPDVLILADVAELGAAETQDVLDWVEAGGLLVRFAGPRLAASGIGQSEEHPLLPVRLRAGGRTVGGAMSWGAPKALEDFAKDSPFFGLAIPDDVLVESQVMAQPDPNLAERVLASLQDGTPLVTAKDQGEGQVVLFHVTANAEWSSLPLSGLFVQLLERLAISARSTELDSTALEGTVWVPEQVLDGFGVLRDAPALAGVDGARLATRSFSAEMPPGVYKSADQRVALNVLAADRQLAAARWPAGTPFLSMTRTEERPLQALLLMVALVLLCIDILATLLVGGRLRFRGATTALMLLLLWPQGDALAQSTPQDDAALLMAANNTVLAYVETGDTRLDDISRAGLLGLSTELFRRTSVEPVEPVGVNLETDELALYPFLYWPVTDTVRMPSEAAFEKVNAFLRGGGLILFDTRDSNIGRGISGGTPNGKMLQNLARNLDIPALEPVPEDHVLTRAFYLLQDFPGRYADANVWVEAAPPDAEQVEGMPFRNLNDGVTPVVIGGNDWASAWAVTEAGRFSYPVGRGVAGERQREIAIRFGVNLIMHVLTGNYKSDQVHVPALLDRLGQ